MFFILTESQDTIAEGLSVIQQWNPDVKPKYFSTDFSEPQIDALNSVYPEVPCYVCEYHVEQAWSSWTSKKYNGVASRKSEIVAKVLKIARSETEEDFQANVADFCKLPSYRKSSLRTYFNETWYQRYQTWVTAFKRDDSVINVRYNNDAQRFGNEVKSSSYLPNLTTCKNMTTFATIMRNQFFVDKYREYVNLNVRSSNHMKTYNMDDVPAYLHDRPEQFVVHCCSRKRISHYASRNDIWKLSNRQYLVQSETKPNTRYLVLLENEVKLPSCACEDWKQNKLPCKHMFALFNCGAAAWEDMSSVYINSVYHNLDYTLVELNSPTSATEVLQATNELLATSSSLVSSEVASTPLVSSTEVSPVATTSTGMKRESVAMIPQAVEVIPTDELLVASDGLVASVGDVLVTTHVEATVEVGTSDVLPTESAPTPTLCYTARDCRVLLNEMRSLTYLVNDSELATEFYEKLDEVRQWLTLKTRSKN